MCILSCAHIPFNINSLLSSYKHLPPPEDQRRPGGAPRSLGASDYTKSVYRCLFPEVASRSNWMQDVRWSSKQTDTHWRTDSVVWSRLQTVCTGAWMLATCPYVSCLGKTGVLQTDLRDSIICQVLAAYLIMQVSDARITVKKIRFILNILCLWPARRQRSWIVSKFILNCWGPRWLTWTSGCL
jgi:hypothetical protein